MKELYPPQSFLFSSKVKGFLPEYYDKKSGLLSVFWSLTNDKIKLRWILMMKKWKRSGDHTVYTDSIVLQINRLEVLKGYFVEHFHFPCLDKVLDLFFK